VLQNPAQVEIENSRSANVFTRFSSSAGAD